MKDKMDQVFERKHVNKQTSSRHCAGERQLGRQTTAYETVMEAEDF